MKLENWFEDYAIRNATDFCCPQGTVSHMEAGWRRMPAFTPECARFLIDLRFTPQQNVNDVEAEFSVALAKFNKDLNIKSSYKRIQTIEASHTSPDDPIIHSAIKNLGADSRQRT